MNKFNSKFQTGAVASAVAAGLVTDYPFEGAPSLKEGTEPSAFNQIREMIEGQAKEAKEARDKVVEKQNHIDGIIEQIQTELVRSGKETSESKTEFQKQVDVVDKLEKDLDSALQQFDDLMNNGGRQVEKSLALQAGEAAVKLDYQGGNQVILKHNGPLFAKDVTGLASSAGALIDPYRAGLVLDADAPLTIRDLLRTVPISTDSVKWAQELLWTNSAAMQDGQGAAKAKSDITFEEKTTAVETLAHYIIASRQVLADAPQLEAIIEGKMKAGLKLKEELQLLGGDGTGHNLDGIVPQATAFDAGLNVSGDKKLDMLRRSILQVRKSYYPADGIVLSPTDWCDIELSKTTDGAYLFANPVDGTTPRVWGKRVVEADSMAAGDFLTGSFAMGATLYDREQVIVRVSDSHASLFIQNMIAILVEERLALTVERPAAFVTGTLEDTA